MLWYAAVGYALIGYLSGSILFARVAAKLFHKEGIFADSEDGNPGTFNAFSYGGFWCGAFTIAGDLLKGCLPVFLSLQTHPELKISLLLALVMTAPVVGHAFPVFYRFQGGKAVAVSFGCLLGLLPFWQPVVILAAFFLFFSLVLKISPNFQRTYITYLCSAAAMYPLLGLSGITLGFWLMTGVVCLRLHISKEKLEKMRVELSWIH